MSKNSPQRDIFWQKANDIDLIDWHLIGITDVTPTANPIDGHTDVFIAIITSPLSPSGFSMSLW